MVLSGGAEQEHAGDALDSGADKKLFEVKRKDQMNALKNLIELNDVNQQYKIIDIMLKGLFKVSHSTGHTLRAQCGMGQGRADRRRREGRGISMGSKSWVGSRAAGAAPPGYREGPAGQGSNRGLWQVLEDSRAVLIAADVPPDGPFPQDEKIKDGRSSLVLTPHPFLVL